MVNIVENELVNPTFDVVANFNGEGRIVGGYLLCSNVKYDVAKRNYKENKSKYDTIFIYDNPQGVILHKFFKKKQELENLDVNLEL